MKNRKGFLLGEETIKIIIAVICIVVLVYFLVSLYLANRDRDLELARASLEKLIRDINAGRTETEIYNPKDWFISSWPRNYAREIMFPKICSDKGWEKCLCICNFESIGCGEEGVSGTCIENDFLIEGDVFQTIEIQNPPLFLSINQQNKTITKKE